MRRNLLRSVLAGESDVEEVSVVADGAEGGAHVGLELVPPQAELVCGQLYKNRSSRKIDSQRIHTFCFAV